MSDDSGDDDGDDDGLAALVGSSFARAAQRPQQKPALQELEPLGEPAGPSKKSSLHAVTVPAYTMPTIALVMALEPSHTIRDGRPAKTIA